MKINDNLHPDKCCSKCFCFFVEPSPEGSGLIRPSAPTSLARTGSFRSSARLIFPKSTAQDKTQQPQQQQQPPPSRFGFKPTWGSNKTTTSSAAITVPASQPAAGKIVGKSAAFGRATSDSQLPAAVGSAPSATVWSAESAAAIGRTVSASRLVKVSPKPGQEANLRNSPKLGRAFDGRNSPKPGQESNNLWNSPKPGRAFDGRNSPKPGQAIDSRCSPKEVRRNSPANARNSPRPERKGSPITGQAPSSNPGEQ